MLALISDPSQLRQAQGLRMVSLKAAVAGQTSHEGLWSGWLEFHFLLLRGLRRAQEYHPDIVGDTFESLRREVLDA